MHTKTLVHIATGKKVCDIEEHFGVMTLEYNPTKGSTATVEMTAPNKVLNNQASTKEKEVEKTPQPITNSEQITHGKSDREHTMELNQSDEGQQKNPSLNNPHPSRQVDSGGGGYHLTKAPNTKNGGRKRRFTKAPNLKNGGPKKQAKSPDITHHKDPNRTQKAW
jgi:hypothetical protein